MGIETALLIGGLVGSAGIGAAIASNRQQKKQAQQTTSPGPVQPAATPTKTPRVADPDEFSTSTEQKKDIRRRGRAALLATSPQGVLGTEPTGRRKIFGN